jgi:hypothetical protein
MKYQTLPQILLLIYGVMCCGLRRVGAKQHERGVCEAPAGVVLFEGKALHIMVQVLAVVHGLTQIIIKKMNKII